MQQQGKKKPSMQETKINNTINEDDFACYDEVDLSENKNAKIVYDSLSKKGGKGNKLQSDQKIRKSPPPVATKPIIKKSVQKGLQSLRGGLAQSVITI